MTNTHTAAYRLPAPACADRQAGTANSLLRIANIAADAYSVALENEDTTRIEYCRLAYIMAKDAANAAMMAAGLACSHADRKGKCPDDN